MGSMPHCERIFAPAFKAGPFFEPNTLENLKKGNEPVRKQKRQRSEFCDRGSPNPRLADFKLNHRTSASPRKILGNLEFQSEMNYWHIKNSIVKKARLSLVSLLLCIGLFPVTAVAVNPQRDITQLKQTVWETSEGLPQNSVNSILQTRDG